MNKERVMGLLRHALTFGGGYAVAQGWVDEQTMIAITGGIVSLLGVVWSISAPEKKGT